LLSIRTASLRCGLPMTPLWQLKGGLEHGLQL
jgi:hypothetical protein